MSKYVALVTLHIIFKMEFAAAFYKTKTMNHRSYKIMQYPTEVLDRGQDIHPTQTVQLRSMIQEMLNIL